MWTVIKTLILKWILRQTFGRFLAILLSVLAPLALLLKAIGLPVLLVLLVLGAPLLLMLAAIGLPVLLVIGMMGVIVAGIFAALKLGLMILAIALPVALAVWIVRWLLRSRGSEDRGPGDTGGASPGSTRAAGESSSPSDSASPGF